MDATYARALRCAPQGLEEEVQGDTGVWHSRVGVFPLLLTFRLDGNPRLPSLGCSGDKRTHLKYVVKGDMNEDRVRRAIEFSRETLCSASNNLEKGGTEITYSYRVLK